MIIGRRTDRVTLTIDRTANWITTDMETSILSLEDCGNVAVVRFKVRDTLFGTDSRAMLASWDAFDKRTITGKRVVYFRMPKDYLSPKLVDNFWDRAREAPVDHAPRHGRALPQMMAAADASLHRSLTFLKSIPAYTVSACEGEVDFDLLGLLLACNYRMCSVNTTFVNRTLKRKVAPGSCTPWFLGKLLGRVKAERLYLDEVSLTADEALKLGIVNHVSVPDSLEQDGLAVAKRFAEYDPTALQSIMKAMDLVDLDLATYLKQAGTGFGSFPESQ
jgi:enoyl-CoA hydratase/carnithine racemase